MNHTPPVIIVGAGLSGLCCARRLHQSGIPVQVLDASDDIGGRIRTDQVDGFLLDRGFQVLLTAYPEAQHVLDYAALDLQAFYPGALVHYAGRFHWVADPWQYPLDAVGSLFSPIGTLSDKLHVGRLRSQLRKKTLGAIFAEPETTTLEALQKAGFSDAIIERFFRPFLSGVFLEPDLQTSSRMFEFVFQMFALGGTALPAGGMAKIPQQLAAGLPAGSIRTHTQVTAAEANSVYLSSGQQLAAQAVVVATEEPEAWRLAGHESKRNSCHVTCLYFAADKPPLPEPILVLNADGEGPVNNLCVPSNIAPSYAPSGAALISASVLESTNQTDPELENDVRTQLATWFGPETKDWQHLRTYHLQHALPGQAPPALSPPERPVRLASGVYMCGDHLDTASIQGAMVSGRRAAEAVITGLVK